MTTSQTHHQAAPDLAIVVNGEPCRVNARDLAALIAELGYGDARVATAVNGSFVPAAIRHAHRLEPGDRVEIVSPRQGG